MELHVKLAQCKLVLSMEYLLVFELVLFVDRQQGAVDVWVFLIQMDDERHDVFFSELVPDELVHILCPSLYLWFPYKM